MIGILFINFIDFCNLLNLADIFNMCLLFTLKHLENIISLKLFLNHLDNYLYIIGYLFSFKSTENVVHQWKFITVIYFVYFAEIIHYLLDICHILEFYFYFFYISVNTLLLIFNHLKLFSVHLKIDHWIIFFILEFYIESYIFYNIIFFLFQLFNNLFYLIQSLLYIYGLILFLILFNFSLYLFKSFFVKLFNFYEEWCVSVFNHV